MIKIKSNKKNLIETLIGFLVLSLFIAVCVLFSACGDDQKITVKNVADLVSNYSDSTDNFLDTEILEKVANFSINDYDKQNLLSASYDLGDNTKTTLESVKVIFTYKDGDNRLYCINEITFDSGIALAQIAEYNKNQNQITRIVNDATISNIYTMTYLIKDDIQNEQLAKEFYEKVIKSQEVPTRLIIKYIGERAFPLDGGMVIYRCNEYDLLVETNNTIKSYNIIIRQDKMENMINNLEEENSKKILETTDILSKQTQIIYKDYVKENISVPPYVPPVDDIEELLSEFPNETSVFLKSQTDTIIEKVTGETKRDNIKYYKCSIGGNTVTKVEFLLVEIIASDPSVEGKETYYYAIIYFDTPIKLVDIANKTASPTIKNVTIEEEFEYNARLMFLKSNTMDAVIERVLKQHDFDPEHSIIMINCVQKDNRYVDYNVIVLSGYRGFSYSIEGLPIGGTEQETIENIKNNLGNSSYYYFNTLDNTITEIEYVREEYTYKDVAELLEYKYDIVKNNVQPIVDYVVNNNITSTANLLSYKIALGEAIDGKISNIKLCLDFNDTSINKNTYSVYKVALPNQLSITDLLDSSNFDNLNLSSQNVVEEYSYTYDSTTQGDKDEFVKAVTLYFDEKFDVEGENVKYLYTFQGEKPDEDYITGYYYQIVTISSAGIREYKIIMPNENVDEYVDMVSRDAFKLQNGGIFELDFPNNQINVVL